MIIVKNGRSKIQVFFFLDGFFLLLGG